MKRFLIWFGIICSCTTFVRSEVTQYSLGFSGDSQTVAISSNPLSPTQILTKDSNVQATWIINPNNIQVFVSSFSANFSTQTYFAIPATGGVTNGPIIWTPDGAVTPYGGQMFAVSVPTTTLQKISVFRAK